MENTVYTQDELTLGEIFKIIWRKIKILILVFLIGAIVGGGFGALTSLNEKYYGTSMEFYVNPTKESTQVESNSEYGVYGTYSRPVMDNIVRLLASESFAEQLLLDKDTGMPKFLDEENPNKELEDKIKEATPYKEAEIKAKENLNIARRATIKAQLAYNDRLDVWNTQIVAGKISEADRVSFFAGVSSNLEEAQDNEKAAEVDYQEAYETAKEFVDPVYELYRRTPIYQKLINAIKSSVTYSYYKTDDDDSVDSLAKSFIYVEISMLGDEKFAGDVYQQIDQILPSYVMDKMPVPTGFFGTSCEKITRMDQVGRINEGHMIKSAIKYALILSVVAFGVACVVVVVVERSHKSPDVSASPPQTD